MEPASLNATGICTLMENRLVVRTWSPQWMAGLMSSSAILVLAVLLIVPTQGILPQDPITTIGIATLLSHSRDLLTMVRPMGAVDDRNFERLLPQEVYKSDVTSDPSSATSRFTIDVKVPHGLPPILQTDPQIRSRFLRPIILHPIMRLAPGGF